MSEGKGSKPGLGLHFFSARSGAAKITAKSPDLAKLMLPVLKTYSTERAR
jgi:hypothetical protein